MRWCERWLKYEAHGKMLFLWMFACLGLQFVYIAGMGELFQFLKLVSDGTGEEVVSVPPGTAFLISAAFVEELLHRFLPLFFAVAIVELLCRFSTTCIAEKMAEWRMSWVIAIAIISSIDFGIRHGGPGHIFFQGVLGFMWCILFLKCGGNQKRFTKALGVTTTNHFLYNWTLFSIQSF